MLELGDNVYSDTNSDVCYKEMAYGQKRAIEEYRELMAPSDNAHAPAVMATWDDHDFCANNQGDDCPAAFRNSSQEAFLKHFGVVNKQDPRWTGQKGVYSATMFGTEPNRDRVNVIMLDTRSSRTATYAAYGQCKGQDSKMLDEPQWSWLESQLLGDGKTSEVVVIGSSIQVLPPTAGTQGQSSVPKGSFCANDAVQINSEGKVCACQCTA